MRNVWQELPRGFVCLAPMEGVTDTVFRRVLLKAGRPDLMFTEFTSMDGLFSRGYDFVKQRLRFEPIERPLIAQIWGMKPENYLLGAQKMVEMGFDGIDINMGCPEKNVIKKGGCSALILNKPLAAEIVAATIEGAAGRLPVSVKIRTGFKEVETEAWAEFLLKLGIDALTVHGRTTKQMSKVPADWGEIGKVVKIADALFGRSSLPSRSAGTPTMVSVGPGPRTQLAGSARLKKTRPVIIGNGDVETVTEAREKVAQYGVDGVMIGRGVFKNPWIFENSNDQITKTKQERLELLEYHVRLWEETWKINEFTNRRMNELTNNKYLKSFNELKRFFKVYVQEFYGAAELRARLMATASPLEAYRCLAHEKQ